MADRLPEETELVSSNPPESVVVLSVFHQLHCLVGNVYPESDQLLISTENILRKIMHADYYRDPVTGNIGTVDKEVVPEHTGHCFDMLRQGVMCAGDIRSARAYNL